MMKFLGGVMVGIFVGALTVEVLARRYPDLLEKVQEKGRRVVDRADELLHKRRADTPAYDSELG